MSLHCHSYMQVTGTLTYLLLSCEQYASLDLAGMSTSTRGQTRQLLIVHWARKPVWYEEWRYPQRMYQYISFGTLQMELKLEHSAIERPARWEWYLAGYITLVVGGTLITLARMRGSWSWSWSWTWKVNPNYINGDRCHIITVTVTCMECVPMIIGYKRVHAHVELLILLLLLHYDVYSA